MKNFINKLRVNSSWENRGDMVNTNRLARVSIGTIFSCFLLFLILCTLISTPVAAARGRETLRSQLYEQFRCGNGLCEVVETRTTCPEDCLPEPEETNTTLPSSPVPFPEQKRGGFESISGVIPSDDLFEKPLSSPHAVQVVSSSSSPTPPPQSTIGFILVVLLIIALIAVVAYTLRKVFHSPPPIDDTSLPPLSFSPDSSSSRVSPSLVSPTSSVTASILARLIEKFKKKGLSATEIYQRVKRMDLWDEQTIRHHLGR